jgi:hypothetical protein
MAGIAVGIWLLFLVAMIGVGAPLWVVLVVPIVAAALVVLVRSDAATRNGITPAKRAWLEEYERSGQRKAFERGDYCPCKGTGEINLGGGRVRNCRLHTWR